jgi:hypothetical protein
MAGVSETHRTAPIFRQPRDNAITGVGAPDLGGPQRLSGHCLSKRPGPVAVHCALLPAKSRSRRAMRPSSPLRSEGAWRSGVENTSVAGSPASFGSRWEGRAVAFVLAGSRCESEIRRFRVVGYRRHGSGPRPQLGEHSPAVGLGRGPIRPPAAGGAARESLDRFAGWARVASPVTANAARAANAAPINQAAWQLPTCA